MGVIEQLISVNHHLTYSFTYLMDDLYCYREWHLYSCIHIICLSAIAKGEYLQLQHREIGVVVRD